MRYVRKKGIFKRSLKFNEGYFEHRHLYTKSSSAWGSTCTVILVKYIEVSWNDKFTLQKKHDQKKNSKKKQVLANYLFRLQFFRS